MDVVIHLVIIRGEGEPLLRALLIRPRWKFEAGPWPALPSPALAPVEAKGKEVTQSYSKTWMKSRMHVFCHTP